MDINAEIHFHLFYFTPFLKALLPPGGRAPTSGPDSQTPAAGAAVGRAGKPPPPGASGPCQGLSPFSSLKEERTLKRPKRSCRFKLEQNSVICGKGAILTEYQPGNAAAPVSAARLLLSPIRRQCVGIKRAGRLPAFPIQKVTAILEDMFL